MKMYSSMGMNVGDSLPLEYTLILNSNSPLIEHLASVKESDADKATLMAAQIYKLSLLSQRHMKADELKEFLSDSFKLLGML